jgi:putative hydrolase of the HAD superfamily
MIRAAIFDIGNVLVRFDLARVLHQLQQSGDPAALLRALEPLRHDFECGKIERAEFVLRAKAALKFPGSDAEFIAAYEDIFTENLPMTRLVPLLAKRYPLFILSNTSELHLDYLLRTFPVFSHFAGGVFSHLAGCTKPARGIYQQAIGQFAIEPTETLYIDDLPANIAMGAEFGLRAVQYDYQRHEEFLVTAAELGIDFRRMSA